MSHTAVVAGSGPNGLAAAIRLAQAGLHVTVHEAAEAAGGATRSEELTLPGFIHDLGSAVHPMAVTSPFFSTLPLKEHGLNWAWPLAELAHPFDDGTAVLIDRDVAHTASQFGPDAAAYRRLFEPLVSNWQLLARELLKPIGWTSHPLLLAQFGWNAIQPASRLASNLFQNERTKTLLAGLAAHSTLRMEDPISAAFALMLGASAHAVGWPVARGGSQSIAVALQSVLRSLGGQVITRSRIDQVSAKAAADVTLCDFTPRQFLELANGKLPDTYRRSLETFRYGPGVYKVDWALREPIPWKARECLRAATVHLGGSFKEISDSEAAVHDGQLSPRPFVILAQPSLFDATRSPQGKHTAWAYCHVPNGFKGSALDHIQAQIERFAPGFRDCVLARSQHSTLNMNKWNENLIGGDINGGAVDWRQFIFRPTRTQYKTPIRGVFFCSSSTPPGGAVHGMCGYWGAQAALRYLKVRS
jgi:phytoene dehydrogenase-like protein